MEEKKVNYIFISNRFSVERVTLTDVFGPIYRRQAEMLPAAKKINICESRNSHLRLLHRHRHRRRRRLEKLFQFIFSIRVEMKMQMLD